VIADLKIQSNKNRKEANVKVCYTYWSLFHNYLLNKKIFLSRRTVTNRFVEMCEIKLNRIRK